ncbi:MAG: hypothetical protein WCO48_02585 [Candidatus Taylorbacteria bacterium]
MKNSRKITYSILSITGIIAAVVILFLVSTATAQACSYTGSCYEYDYGYGYDYGYYDQPSYGFVYSAPSYSYSPAYSYASHAPSQPVVTPITASCYASPQSASVGNSVQWIASVSGGYGSYDITWSGDEDLRGSGSSVNKVYSYAGYKNASISVRSGGQTIPAVACANPVNVTGQINYPYNYNSNYNYNYSNYQSQVSASCIANTSYAPAGSSVIWTATATGGNGYYTYIWSGTDYLSGNGQAISYAYNNPGSKSAYVQVSSNGQTTTAYCTNSVTVSGSTNYGSIYGTGYIQNNAGLDVGCYADPKSINVNQPTTWNTEVTGGIAPYTYSWTGSDGLDGKQSSVIKYYSTVGEKNAIVTVTSANGLSSTRACSNTVTVHTAGYTGAGTGTNTNTTNTTNTSSTTTVNQGQNGGQLSASSIFSFDNIPWGWIAILIILVLFATVMYLLFNKQKI